MLITDDLLKDAIALLDRINILQHMRNGHEVDPADMPHWHRPEDIMHALATIDMMKTRGMLDQQMALMERRMRQGSLDG